MKIMKNGAPDVACVQNAVRYRPFLLKREKTTSRAIGVSMNQKLNMRRGTDVVSVRPRSRVKRTVPGCESKGSQKGRFFLAHYLCSGIEKVEKSSVRNLSPVSETLIP